MSPFLFALPIASDTNLCLVSTVRDVCLVATVCDGCAVCDGCVLLSETESQEEHTASRRKKLWLRIAEHVFAHCESQQRKVDEGAAAEEPPKSTASKGAQAVAAGTNEIIMDTKSTKADVPQGCLLLMVAAV